jgi:glycosyltransferase involved in cell wall biosynthesis
MKILFITNTCPQYHVRPFEEISKRYHVDFVFFDEGPNYHNRRVNFQEARISYQFVPPGILRPLRIFRLAIRKDYDVMIKCVAGGYLPLYAYILARLSRRKFIFWSNIWHYGKSLRQRVGRSVHFFLYKKSDAVVTYGFHINNFILKNLPELGRTKLFESFNVVDNSEFDRECRPSDIQELKTLLCIGSEKVILYVGRIAEVKGLNYLLDAFRRIERDFNVKLLIVGEGDLVIGSKRIIKLDFVENKELYKYYTLADIVVLPSITTEYSKETWGIVINEAMNCGTAIVATDAVGAAVGGLLTDGENGLVVPERDSEALASAFVRLLSDEDLLARMKRINREKIKSFNETLFADGFAKAIEYAFDSKD